MRLTARTTLAIILAALSVWSGRPAALVAQPGPAPEPGQQIVLITGSTSGLGREVALRMGARGAHVIVHGRDEQRGMAVVDEINAGPGSARFYAADFASFDNVRALAHSVLR
ncbi:MAG: SDR family NAD(P)-dependent oxidoreductase, partial [Longimicrobiales bacterium]|nr:SDR family NAD(P)-dependent oxidoreductase [Longimicrobiales bacterium]